MNRTIAFGLISVLLLLPASTGAASFEGPLMVRNAFPLFLPVNAPVMESASASDTFSAGISHSSVFLMEESRNWTAQLDMETTIFNLSYRKKVRESFELGIDIPLISHASGFMDGFLENYHSAFGFPDYGRSRRPENAFLFSVQKNGASVIQGKDGSTGIGDVRLIAKKVLSEGDPVISLKAEVELPTGQATRGYGNGSIDAGAALLIDKRLGERFMTRLNIGMVFPGDWKAEETVRLRNFLYGGAGLEALLWEKISLLGQILFQSSPLPKTGIGEIDRVSALLSLGGRYTSGKDCVEFSLTEDPNTAGAPDVAFNLSYKRRF